MNEQNKSNVFVRMRVDPAKFPKQIPNITRDMSVSLSRWRKVSSRQESSDSHYEKAYNVDQSMLLDKYKKFTPATMHRQISQRLILNLPFLPHSECVFASVLIADISGFTRLSSRFNAEELKRHINEYFSKLLGIIRRSGGDVIKFLGDAVLIIFPVDVEARLKVKAATVLMASLCALSLVRECGNYKQGEGQNEVILSLHCGISSGNIHCMCMGEDERWEFLVSGQPLHQVGNAMNDAKVGEVCISEESMKYIEDQLETKKTTNGNYLLTGKLVSHVTDRGSISTEHSFISKNLLKRLSISSLGDHQGDNAKINVTRTSGFFRQASRESTGSITSNQIKQMSFQATQTKEFATNKYLSRESFTTTKCDSSEHFPKDRDNFDFLAESKDSDDPNKNRNTINSNNNNILTTTSITTTTTTTTTTSQNFGQNTKIWGIFITINRFIQILKHETLLSRNSGHSRKVFIDTSSHPPPPAPLAPPSTPSRGTPSLKKSRLSELANDALLLSRDIASVNAVRTFLRGYLEDDPTMNALLSGGVGGDLSTINDNSKSDHKKSHVLDEALTPILRRFVHDAVRSAFDNRDGTYLFELRTVTTIFIEFLGLDEDLNSGSVERPQKVMSICLCYLKRFGGSLRQYTVDDKGCVLIGAFGLPGSSHEDNSRRAIEAALSISHALTASNIGSKIGISEGRVYCGLVGCIDRCEYAMMGASVNLAARLMGSCLSGQVLVSESSYLPAQASFVFKSMARIDAKGYSSPVAVYRPTERAYGNVFLNMNSPGDVGFVGRLEELNILVSAIIQSRENGNSSNFYIVSGPPSIGKTRLVVEALRQATSKPGGDNLKVAEGTASAAYTSLQYYVSRQLLERILELQTDEVTILTVKRRRFSFSLVDAQKSSHRGSSHDSLDLIETAIRNWIIQNFPNPILDLKFLPRLPDITFSTRKKVFFEAMKTIEDNEVKLLRSYDSDIPNIPPDNNKRILTDDNFSLLELVPLLGEVLGIRLTDNWLTRELKKPNNTKRKRDIIEAMMCQLLTHAFTSTFDIILLDNLQWCDSLSLRIIMKLARKLPRGVLIATSRLIDEVVRSDSLKLMDVRSEAAKRQKAMLLLHKESVLIELNPLSYSDIKEIIERTVGARICLTNPSVLSSVNINSIIERCGGSAFHASVLASNIRYAIVKGKFTGVEDLPAGDNNIVISQFDQLSKRDQAVIKTAAVIGANFTTKDLNYVLKLLRIEDCDSLPATMDRLVASHLINSDLEKDNDENQTYHFADRTTLDSIYNLMLASQREKIHAIMGGYLLKTRKQMFDDIAHHFILSNNTHLKLQYLEKDTRKAKAEGAYHRIYKNLNIAIKSTTGSEVEVLLTRRTPTEDNHSSLPFNLTAIFAHASSVLSTSMHAETKSKLNIFDAETDDKTNRKYYASSDLISCANLLTSKKDKNVVSVVTFSKWLAEMGLAQFMSGNLTEASNLFSFSMRNLELPSQGTSRNFRNLCCIASDLPLSSIPIVSWKDFDTFLDAFECLIFISLLRGMSLEARRIGVFLRRVFDSIPIDEEKWLEEARVVSVTSVTVNASCDRLKDRQKAWDGIFMVRDIIMNSSSQQVVADSAIYLSLATHAMSLSKWGDAIEYSRESAQHAHTNGSKVKEYLSLLVYAWCNFIAGMNASARSSLEKVLVFSSSESFVPMQVWALELDILMKTFSRDFEGAEEAQRLIRTLQRRGGTHTDAIFRKENFNATTSAIVAFSMVCNRQFERACPIAVYAALRLKSRKQGIALAGIYYFCCIYALLECAYFRREMEENSYQFLKSSLIHRGGEDSCYTRSKDILKLANKTVAKMANSVTSYPCWAPLVWTLMLKLRSVERIDFSSMGSYLFELRLAFQRSGELLQSFVFAEAFIHYQRVKILKYIEENHHSEQDIDDSTSIVIYQNNFQKLGGCPHFDENFPETYKSRGSSSVERKVNQKVGEQGDSLLLDNPWDNDEDENKEDLVTTPTTQHQIIDEEKNHEDEFLVRKERKDSNMGKYLIPPEKAEEITVASVPMSMHENFQKIQRISFTKQCTNDMTVDDF